MNADLSASSAIRQLQGWSFTDTSNLSVERKWSLKVRLQRGLPATLGGQGEIVS